MNPHERIRAVLAGERPDRPAFAIWRHFPDVDTSPRDLAAATIDFARTWRPDLIKHTPNGMYAVEDWVMNLTGGKSLETDPNVVPYSLNLEVNWQGLTVLDVEQGALGRDLQSLRLVCDEIGGRVPVYMTVFGPLTLAGKLAGVRTIQDMRQRPDDLREGLRTITKTTKDYMKAVREAGADGLYFATQYASEDLLTEDEHAEFGAPYDIEVLEAWCDLDGGPVILHLCGANIFFDLCNNYPVEAVCWDHGLSQPAFDDAFDLTDRTLVAGMEESVFPVSAQTVYAQAADALAVSRGMRHILAPTCVIPAESTDESLAVVVNAVENCDFKHTS